MNPTSIAVLESNIRACLEMHTPSPSQKKGTLFCNRNASK